MLSIHIKMPGLIDCVKTPKKNKTVETNEIVLVTWKYSKIHKTLKTKECIMIYHVNTNEEEMALRIQDKKLFKGEWGHSP